jgi:transketolase
MVRVLEAARRGHIGSTFSLVEMLRVLYDDILRYRPLEPGWPDRDRCILSKGHGCIALYALLAEKGFFPKEELLHFCAYDGMLGGHPDARKIPGIETSTGSLGHGLAFGVGMALDAKSRGREHRVFVVTGDGECNEGAVWEAALCAGKHHLDNLTVLVDYNHMQSYGAVADVQPLEPFADKWRAFGFSANEVDGHDVVALREALEHVPFERGKPSALLCHTVKGKGFAFAENQAGWHHKAKLSDGDIAQLYAALGDA